MCGIAGIIWNRKANQQQISRSFFRLLEHRGPDDHGWLLLTPKGIQKGRGYPNLDKAEVLLLHRRLSILDLSEAGHQPMGTQDGRYSIAFNGEIYNYLELRRELETLGHTFNSKSDTEVLLYAYIQCGKEAIHRLNGMFAFAILDTYNRTLFLARDFFGIKPLYYTPLSYGFGFASEIKALVSLPGVSRQVNPDRLYDYLRFGKTDHGQETLFSQIRQLPAGHFLEIDIDHPTESKPESYWQIKSTDPVDMPFEEASSHLRDLFLDNINLQLRGDAPIGAALSGGIDSTAIVSAIRHLKPHLDLQTFSYIADDPALSEEHWVDIAGNAGKMSINKVHLRSHDVVEELDQIVKLQDEPFGGTSIFAQHGVFRRAKECGVKVMLDGQGADELFGGYNFFFAARIASLVRQGKLCQAFQFWQKASKQPGSGGIRKVFLQTGNFLAPGLRPWALQLAGKGLMPGWLNRSWFTDQGVTPRCQQIGSNKEVLRQKLQESMYEDSLPMLLRYEDRNSMACSVESRVPFLTVPMVNFVMRLPEEYLIAPNGTTKNIFRHAMRGIVPDAVLDRRDKIGFATPEWRWLSNLRHWVQNILTSETARSLPALNSTGMKKEWQDMLNGRRPFDSRVWRWINTIRWVDRFSVSFSN